MGSRYPNYREGVSHVGWSPWLKGIGVRLSRVGLLLALIVAAGCQSSPVSRHAATAADADLPGQAFATYGLQEPCLAVVDLHKQVVTSLIKMPNEPVGVVIAPDRRTAYTWSLAEESIVPLDMAGRKPGTPIGFPEEVNDVKLSPNGKWLYVTVGERTFLIVDTKTRRVVTRLNVSGGVGVMVLSHDGTRAYTDSSALLVRTSEAAFQGAGNVTTIDLSRRVVGHRFTLRPTAEVLATSPDDKSVYVTAPSDTSEFALFALTPGTGRVALVRDALPFPPGLVLQPSGTMAFVATSDDSVAPLDLQGQTIGADIAIPSNATFTLSPRGKALVAAGFEGIAIVDVSTGRVSPRIKLPACGSKPGFGPHPALDVTLIPGS